MGRRVILTPAAHQPPTPFTYSKTRFFMRVKGAREAQTNTHQQTPTTTAKQEEASIKFETTMYKQSPSAYTNSRCRPYVYREIARRKYECGSMCQQFFLRRGEQTVRISVFIRNLGGTSAHQAQRDPSLGSTSANPSEVNSVHSDSWAHVGQPSTQRL